MQLRNLEEIIYYKLQKLFWKDQLVRGARPAFGVPCPSANLLPDLRTQGVNSSFNIDFCASCKLRKTHC